LQSDSKEGTEKRYGIDKKATAKPGRMQYALNT
jgi:hypothetical protein